MEVHHQQCPPLPALILYNTTLMDIGACRSVLIDLRDTKLCTILTDAIFHALWYLRQRGGMIAKGLISSDSDGLIRSPDALGTRTEGSTVRLIIGRDEVIHAIDLIHVMSLTHGIAFRNNGTLCLLDRSAHVGFQFRTLYLTIAMNGIDFLIVVE